MYIYISKLININIWATVNIWYIAPSDHFLKSVLSVFKLWYISKCYRFLKSALSFSKPQLNLQKITMSGILLSIDLNFGCSSYLYVYIYNTYIPHVVEQCWRKTPSSKSSQSNRYTQIHKPPRGMVSGSRFMPWYHLSGGSIPYPKISKRGMQISVYRVLWITKPWLITN